MSIKGLTDRGARFPQVGILRKGAPKPESGNKPGADLQYFRFDTDDGAALAAFRSAYGDEPAVINVYLPFATPEESFSAWQEEYGAGGLVHRCDGETMVMWRTEQGTYSQERRPCPYEAGAKARTRKEPGCKAVGRLMVIIPELRRMAYVTVATTSINDIIELQGNLDAAYALRGDLRGIPFILRRSPRMISTPGTDGNRVRREKWLLSLEPAPEWVSLQIQTMRRNALPGAGEMLALSGAVEDDDVIDAEHVSVEGVGPINLVTGEIVDDDEPEPEPHKSEPKLPLTKPLRPQTGGPLSPEDLYTYLNALRAWGNTQAGFNGKREGWLGAFVGHIDRLTQDGGHHEFGTWAFNMPSAKQWDDGVLWSFKVWLNMTKDENGDWFVDEMAAAELLAAFPVALTAAGQGVFDLEAAAAENPDSIHAEVAA